MPDTAGKGGAGISGSNLNIINAGGIEGGLWSDAPAIKFTGGTNRLTLLAGSSIWGNVLAYSHLDTLELSGDEEASLDTNPYKGFGRFVKTGASTWTLTAGNPALTPWNVNAGTLSIASDAALGDLAGGLALDGGALRTTADIETARVVALGGGGGTFRPDSGTTLSLSSPFAGAGDLIQRGAGTLRLTADNGGFAGNTLVAAGRLQLEGALTTPQLTVADTGSAVVDVLGQGMLQSDSTHVGREEGSQGQVRFSGSAATGSLGQAVVGSAGTGALTIENGASVEARSLALGDAPTGNGSLLVRGAGSRLDLGDGAISIGGDGSGLAEVQSGGQIHADGIGIGGGDNALGRLILKDADSTVQTVHDLSVTHGVASVSGGAQLVVGRSTFIDRAGAIEVSGPDTSFESPRTSVLGGRLSVSDGAQAKSSIIVSGNGLASISGAGSRLVAEGLDIGDGDEGGSMVVSDGASLVSTGINRIGRPGSVGALTLTGAGTTWDHNASLARTTIGQRGIGRLTIENGAVAHGASAVIGFDAGADGGVLVSGTNSRWTLSGTLEIAPGTNGNGEAIGALTVRKGAKVEVPSIVLSRSQGTAALNIGAAPGEAAAGAGQVVADSVVLGSANASLNFNHLDADHAFAPAIEGTGTIRVLSGGTRFTGNSTHFQGPLQISGGTAFVDRVLGDGSVAATVTGAGSLGGSGTLGGKVDVSEGGHLLGRSGQTLTMGQLVLGNASNLDVALGAYSPQALFQVNGDLTLGGKLNVSDSGGFGAGIYRLINYTGTLTDNGLAIGSAPIDPAQLEVQTALAHQVNLVNRSGPALSFWDGGDSAAYDNGTVDGGKGRWGTGTMAWTGADGQVNAGWNPRAFAVFQGKPGTVTVDDSAGPVAFGGAQFAVDGYRLEGGALRTDAPDTLIRVGDGSAAGAAMRATIAAPITGSGGLVKNDLGTLVLAGANSYAGPTTVSAGTLRADAPGALSSGSAFTVASGATLDLAGHSQAIASMAHSGTVNLAGSAPGTTLTVKGPWIGNGGTLRLSTALGDSRSPSDRLVLDGPAATASGRTQIQVANHGGLGAMTTGNGIEVVTAMNGATTTAQTSKDAFSLAGGHVDAGAYEYRLFAADADGKGENWYLRSSTGAPAPAPGPAAAPAPAPVPAYRTEVPLLAALPAQLRQADVAMLASSHRRSGDDDAGAPAVASLEPVAASLTSDRRAWARAIHDDLDLRQPGAVAPASKGRITGLQAGTDLFASGDGRWRGGVYVGSQDGRADVSGLASGLWRRVGANDLRARYLGAYAGFENATGFYADAVLQHGTHNYTARPLDGLPVGGKGRSLTASLELGQAFRLAGSWTLEPQLQLMHRHARLDDAALPLALVRQDDGSGWQARAGVRIKGDLATAAGRLQPYARLDVHRGSGSSTAQFIGPGGSTGITSGMGHTSVGLAGGATLALGRSASLYGEIGKLFSTGSGARVASSVQGAIGLRVRW